MFSLSPRQPGRGFADGFRVQCSGSMASSPGLSTEDRVAIDRVFEGLEAKSHYEVLRVAEDAAAEDVADAVRELRRRFDATRLVGSPSDEYRRRLLAVLRAVDAAETMLCDPSQRVVYDHQLERRRPRGGSPSAREAPATMPPPPRTATLPHGVVVPPPIVRPTGAPVPSRTMGTERPTPNAAPAPAPAPAGSRAPAPAPPSAAPPPAPTLLRDLDAIAAEVERIAVAVQFCIAQALDPRPERVQHLQTAGQALTDTRVTLAALQAQHAEESGSWAEAAVHWQRMMRARPSEPVPLARLAECLRRAGDLVGAEESARRALALDPENQGARATLSALGGRPERS